ncbi:MAG: hypothetical protein V1720_18855 [bacterium]
MSNETKETITGFSDYLYVLFKWKKFLIINLFIVIVFVSIIVLLIPNKYKSTATIMIPPDNQGGLGNLSGLLSGKSSIASMGSKLFGVSNTSEDVLLGIINSKSALTNIIRKFKLMHYYDIDDDNIDQAIKSFIGDISTEPNEFGMVDISIINEDPQMSANIANYIVDLVDSINIKINIEQAKNNREFIEKRYLQNVTDLRKAEDSLYEFQRKYGIVVVPDQLEATVKVAAEIESETIKKEMQAYFLLQQYGEDSPQYKGVKAELKMLKDKTLELKNSPNLRSSSNILYAFKNMPEMSIAYLRSYREVEIQQTILEFVMPMYEQAKVEEQKSIPTVVVIDKAVPAQLKNSPKRTIIVLSIFFLFSFAFIPIIFIGEKAVNRLEYSNPLQKKSAIWFNKIKKFYRMRF